MRRSAYFLAAMAVLFLCPYARSESSDERVARLTKELLQNRQQQFQDQLKIVISEMHRIRLPFTILAGRFRAA